MACAERELCEVDNSHGGVRDLGFRILSVTVLCCLQGLLQVTCDSDLLLLPRGQTPFTLTGIKFKKRNRSSHDLAGFPSPFFFFFCQSDKEKSFSPFVSTECGQKVTERLIPKLPMQLNIYKLTLVYQITSKIESTLFLFLLQRGH